jgi:hypothetical protein
MHRAGDVGEIGFVRIVLAGDLYTVANFDIGFNQLPHCLRGTAIGRGHAGDNMEYMQYGACNS